MVAELEAQRASILLLEEQLHSVKREKLNQEEALHARIVVLQEKLQLANDASENDKIDKLTRQLVQW